MDERTSGGGEREAGEETGGTPVTRSEEDAARRASERPHAGEAGEIPADTSASPGRGGQRPEEFSPDDFE